MDAARLRVTRGPRTRVRRKMEDPVSRRLVLPLTRLEQVAHDGYRSGTTHALRRLQRLRETEHLMATGHEDLDQLRADESGGSRNKRGRPRVACHVASVECAASWRPPTAPAQDSYDARTGRGSKMNGP